MSSEHLLVGGKPEEFLKWTTEILARDPEQLDALRLSVRYYGWQRDETGLKNSLERLVEVARFHGAIDDERYALSQLVMILPHEVAYAKRLQEITLEFGGEMPEPVIEGFHMNTAVEFQTAEGAFGPIDDFAAVERGDAGDQTESFDDYVTYASEIGLGEAEESFVYNESNSNQNGIFGADTEASAASLDFEFKPSAGSFEAGDAVAPATGAGHSFELSAAEEMRLAEEVESIEFYITQGYHDLADKTICGLESEFGARPEFARLREQLEKSLPAEEAEVVPQIEILEAKNIFAQTETFVEETPAEAPVLNVPPAGGQNSYDFLSDFRSDLGLEEAEQAELEEEGDYETHYQTAIVYKEMGLMEESIREFQDAVNLVRCDDGTRRFFQCCNLLGLCFMKPASPTRWAGKNRKPSNTSSRSTPSMSIIATSARVSTASGRIISCFRTKPPPDKKPFFDLKTALDWTAII
jgi:hypothetical protein